MTLTPLVMLISHEKKFLFVHIQKTAGSSLTQLLTEFIPDLVPYMGTHDHAVWAKNKGEFIWDEYYKVAFVRNPWDRLLSWYMMITQFSEYFVQQGSAHQINHLWRYVLENSTSFESFLYNCTATIDDNDGKKNFLFNQLDYVTDESGKIIVDFVGRFESLHDDMQQVFDGLHLSDLELAHHNASTRSHYQDYYTHATRRLVARRYERDIDFFGYCF